MRLHGISSSFLFLKLFYSMLLYSSIGSEGSYGENHTYEKYGHVEELNSSTIGWKFRRLYAESSSMSVKRMMLHVSCDALLTYSANGLRQNIGRSKTNWVLKVYIRLRLRQNDL